MRKLIFAAIVSVIIAVSAGAIPQYINYQGILRDSSGDLQDGTFSMVFKIYDAETLGSEKFTSGATDVTVSNGLYNVRLGSVDTTVFDGGNRWLEITVDDDTLAPRLQINSVAYAIRAEVADTATDATNVSGGYVSAEADSPNFALFVNGRLGAVTCVGTGEIASGIFTTDVTNVPVTSNSLILLTVGNETSYAENTNGGIRILSINPGTNQFRVATMDGKVASNRIPFFYLIIN